MTLDLSHAIRRTVTTLTLALTVSACAATGGNSGDLGKADSADDIDWSQLQPNTSEPTVESLRVRFDALASALATATLDANQQNALFEMEQAFTTQVTDASLKLSWSRGPGWKADAAEWIEDNYDIWEDMSYIGEQASDVRSYCNFAEMPDDWSSYLEDYEFVWNSVKPVTTGRADSIAYVVYLVIPVQGLDASGQLRGCDFPRSAYGFSGDLDSSGALHPLSMDGFDALWMQVP